MCTVLPAFLQFSRGVLRPVVVQFFFSVVNEEMSVSGARGGVAQPEQKGCR